jgi:hypothetical protein
VGLWRHLLVFGALVVNLWVGGDLVETYVGPMARFGFEAVLILGYLWFVIGLGGLLRGEPDDSRPGDGPR